MTGSRDDIKAWWFFAALLAVLGFMLLIGVGGAGLALIIFLGLCVGVGGWYLFRWLGVRNRPISH